MPENGNRNEKGNGNRRVWIRFTEEQKRGIKEVTGREAEGISFSHEELDDRLAPTLPLAKHLHGLWVVLGLDD